MSKEYFEICEMTVVCQHYLNELSMEMRKPVGDRLSINIKHAVERIVMLCGRHEELMKELRIVERDSARRMREAQVYGIKQDCKE